jgi:hypothetical protein
MSTAPELQQPTVAPDAPPPAPRSRRRLLVAVAAGVVVLGAVAATSFTVLRPHDEAARLAGPLNLPEQLGKQHPIPAASDLTQRPDWMKRAATQLGGASYVARTFGTDPQAPTTRVVVAKTDLTGKLELGWAADQGKEFGDVRCTQNIKLGERVAVRPTVSLCWRTSPSLSAYALLIDTKHHVRADAAAAALTEAWTTIVP